MIFAQVKLEIKTLYVTTYTGEPLVRFRNWIFGAQESRPGLVLLLAVFFTFSMWFFVDRVWAPPTDIHFSDLYPSWYGSRELLLHGRDPYALAVSREIQVWSDGHALDQESKLGIQNEHRFAYPQYVAFLLAPTVGLSYPTVQSLFRIIMPALALLSVPLWMAALRWKCSRTVLGPLMLLSFGSFPALESIYLQQPVLITAALLAGAIAALARGRLFWAGMLLALASIKPQLVGLLTLWLLVWAISSWRSRQRLVWGFGISMFVLVAASEFLLPGWIGEFVAGVVAYQHYTGNFSILVLFFGRLGGGLVSLALIAGFGYVAWRLREAPAGSERFNLAICLMLSLTVVVIPTVYPTGQLVLLPCVFWLLKSFSMIWENGRACRLAFIAAFSLIVWPWVGAAAFMLARLFVPSYLIRELWIVPLSTLLLAPSATLVMMGVVTPAVLRSEC